MDYSKHLSEDDLSSNKDFIEKHVLTTPANSSILKYTFLNTPAFISADGETISKVVVCLLDDFTLHVYSLESGEQLKTISIMETVHADSDVSLIDSEVVSLIPNDLAREMSLILMLRNGNVYNINLGIVQIDSKEMPS